MNSDAHPSEEERVDEIAQRVAEMLVKIRSGTKFVPKDGKLSIELTFEDEIDLAEQWMLTLADCKFLLKKLGRELP